MTNEKHDVLLDTWNNMCAPWKEKLFAFYLSEDPDSIEFAREMEHVIETHCSR